jgi:hypothetical protein
MDGYLITGLDHSKYSMNKADEELLARARKRFNIVSAFESESRTSQLEDIKFRAGSPDNEYQWPAAVRGKSATSATPRLTSNRIAQSIAQVVNDSRQNRPSIKCLPVDSGADVKTAEMLDGLIRHIHSISDADIAFDTAIDSAVTCGIGFIRVLTEYASDDTFDQEIIIKRVRNPLTVYLDPECQDPTGADARYAFVTSWLEKEDFEARYPKAVATSFDSDSRGDAGQWYGEQGVRIAEYWERDTSVEKLHKYYDGSYGYSSEDDGSHGEPIDSRDMERKLVRCFTICGNEVLSKDEWAGQHIPIARVVGNELDIEGRVQFTGMVRNAKDAQRLINLWDSREAEMLALAPKSPFIGVAGQFEGFEREWGSANIDNRPYLEYNPVVDTDAGPQAFPAPQRQMPPPISQGILQAKQGAIDGLKAVTGIFDASLGQRSNETSGKAILARQRQGDNASFNYIDNLARAIRYVGRIIVDLIPSIYDTPRVARILGEDGVHSMASIDPNADQSYSQVQGQDGSIQSIYNPGVGRYDVVVTTGPSYNTKRQEAAEGMIALTQTNPDLWPIIGDLLVNSLDWPGADKMAKRLKAMLPPQAAAADKSDDDNQAPQIPPEIKQQMDQMMQQHEQLTQALHEAQDKLDEEAKDKELDVAKLQIEHYRAETERMKALEPAINPREIAELAAQLVMQAMHSPSQPEPKKQESAKKK